MTRCLYLFNKHNLWWPYRGNHIYVGVLQTCRNEHIILTEQKYSRAHYLELFNHSSTRYIVCKCFVKRKVNLFKFIHACIMPC